METLEIILLLFGQFLAFNAYAYIFFDDHRLYPLTEGVILGGITANGLLSTYNSIQSSAISPISAGKWILIIPIILGLSAFTRFTRYRWIARYPTTILAGIGIGTLFGLSIKAQMFGNIIATIDNVLQMKPDLISALIVLVGFVTSMTYFLYSLNISGPLQPKRSLNWVLRIGRLFLYGGLGYLFVRSGGAGGTSASWVGLYIKDFVEALKTIF